MRTNGVPYPRSCTTRDSGTRHNIQRIISVILSNIHPPLHYPRIANCCLQELKSWRTPERDGRGEAGVDDRHQLADWHRYDDLGKYSSNRCIVCVFGNYIL